MVRHLFKDFLKNKKVYILNENYWKNRFNHILPQGNTLWSCREWLTTKSSKGIKFFDGNPIFSVLCLKQNRAIRIVQEEPNSQHLSISAWLDEFPTEDDQETIKELVIVLELSKESQKITEALIQAWLVEKVSQEEMQNLIEEKLTPAIVQIPQPNTQHFLPASTMLGPPDLVEVDVSHDYPRLSVARHRLKPLVPLHTAPD